ncbi:MAG: hypothetical protein ACI91Q_001685 [Gammaproteobacteria bacterium]
MKPLAIWLAAIAVVFGGYALVASSTQNTLRVFVFVDSSNPMTDVWRHVPGELDRIGDAERSEFALAHGQRQAVELLHSWQSELRLSGVEPFAPCSFDALDDFTEAAEADKRILVTTTDSCDTSALVGWDIIALEP